MDLSIILQLKMCTKTVGAFAPGPVTDYVKKATRQSSSCLFPLLCHELLCGLVNIPALGTRLRVPIIGPLPLVLGGKIEDKYKWVLAVVFYGPGLGAVGDVDRWRCLLAIHDHHHFLRVPQPQYDPGIKDES